MAIPSFARFPPKALWDQLLPEEWEACLDSWIFLVKAYLMLSNKVFNMNLSKDNSLPEFLISYLQQNSNTEKHSLNSLERIRLLHSNVFLLIHRALTHADPRPLLLLEASFLEDLSLAYSGHLHLRELIAKTWTSRKLDNSKSFLERKQSLTRMLEESGRITSSEEVEDALHRTASLVKALYLYGQFLMVGSDFLDSLVTCYEHQASALQKKVVITAYLCLSSLMQVENPKISTLIDHLYSLKNASGQSILLKEICSSTPFLRKFRDRLSGSEASRAQSMLQQLGAFEKTANGKTKKPIRRRTVKGKSRAIEDLGYGASHDVHIHKMSMITQIQDLFPHLGSAFIVKLLEEYKDSIEQVTAHVLEDSLPTYLKQADHSENLSVYPSHRVIFNLKIVTDLNPTYLMSNHQISSRSSNLIRPQILLLNLITTAPLLGGQYSMTTHSRTSPSHHLKSTTAAPATPLKQQIPYYPPLPPNQIKPPSSPPLRPSTPMTTSVMPPTTQQTSAAPLTPLFPEQATTQWTRKP